MELPSYKYLHLTSKKPESNSTLKLHIYTFSNNKGRKYIVYVEQYKYNSYIIKFFPKELSNYKYKFNILTGRKNVRPIVNTCLKILLEILNKDPLASFGFIGAHTYDPKNPKVKPEGKSNTKRFRVYGQIAVNLLGDATFEHRINEQYSGYLLVNKKNTEPKLGEKLEKMFKEVYVLNLNN